MFRVLVLTSLIAVVGLAAPAVAAESVETRGDCSHLVIAFTESDEAHADIYISRVVDFQGDPRPVESATLYLTILEAIKNVNQPGEVSRGSYMVQIDLQLPHNEDPEVTGIRLTYAVDVIACSGL